ncbi:hypothetical protein ACFL2G_05145 [Candidatus Omnitrophota bacterium]
MIRFKKGYNLIVIFIAITFSLLLNDVSFSDSIANDTLRLPIDSSAMEKRMGELTEAEIRINIKRKWDEMWKNQSDIFEIVGNRNYFSKLPDHLREEISYAALSTVKEKLANSYKSIQWIGEGGNLEEKELNEKQRELLQIEKDLNDTAMLTKKFLSQQIKKDVIVYLGFYDSNAIDKLARQSIEAFLNGIKTKDDELLLGMRTLILETIEVFDGLRKKKSIDKNEPTVAITFMEEGEFNEKVLEVARTIDKTSIGPEDNVLIIGEGSNPLLSLACALKAGSVDIAQPDKYVYSYEFESNQYKDLKIRLDRIRKQRGSVSASIIDKIDIEKYRGLAEDVNLPKRHYSYVFIPAVLDYLNSFERSKKEKLVKAILPTLENNAVVLISTLSGTKVEVNQEADFFQKYAEERGYSITERKNIGPIHAEIDAGPTVELNISRETKKNTEKEKAKFKILKKGNLKTLRHQL